MDVLRQDISVGFWNKPSYLISLVIRELAKPPRQRAEWLMWVDADSIILNRQVPMQIFLPPSDLGDIHLVVSKDHQGLNTGIMFLQVHPWTVTFLSETMGYPLYLPQEDLGRSADQESMRRVLDKTTGGPNGEGYADGVVYLPRPWINTYEWSHAYEGKKGDLLVHFPGLEEQRWPHMAKWLDIVEKTPQQWEVPLEETDYPKKTSTFWSNVRDAKQSIKKAENILKSDSSQNTADLTGAMEELQEALREKTDDLEIFQQHLDSLKRLIGEI
ncbi:hypothetical protein N7490_009654 [Penicillium lividum]|nr:hypothetical protein N7490_009654 [Penicillium lividum]